MQEKLQQFVNLKLNSFTYDGDTLVLNFDTDGDPNTEETIALTIGKAFEENIRVD